MTAPTEIPDTITAREVATQPDIWHRALTAGPDAYTALPAPGTPVLVVGCGTSYYVGDAYARLRESAGLGRTRAVIASELDRIGEDETVLVISRSGTTTDVLRVIERAAGRNPVAGILGTPHTPIADACDAITLLDYADEVSVVQTRFASTVLTVLRHSLGLTPDTVADQARTALARPLPEPGHTQFVFLGTNWTVGVAQEAALKCRESAGVWTEAYALWEYQHGPISVAGPHTLVWSLSPVPPVVADAVRATGATLVEPELDAMAELVAVHRLALRLAAAADRDPDTPPHLSRSVQLV
ncbi:SIS domain-containing protein [Kitasatospora indigofera]|uniref:SIS domain-containing protein n=1 Tax=Kitasatospora indigofera TaxID=67307 RepID=UPI003650B6D5